MQRKQGFFDAAGKHTLDVGSDVKSYSQLSVIGFDVNYSNTEFIIKGSWPAPATEDS